MRAEGIYDDWQRIGEDFREESFLTEIHAKCQLFCWRIELCVYAGLVAARIDAIPATLGQMNGIQPVQGIWRAVVVNAETLIAETGGNVVCAQ